MVNYDSVAGMGLARGRRPAMVMKYVIVAGVPGDASYFVL